MDLNNYHLAEGLPWGMVTICPNYNSQNWLWAIAAVATTFFVLNMINRLLIWAKITGQKSRGGARDFYGGEVPTMIALLFISLISWVNP